ncbi:Kinesin-like_protein [Hexamita inflata]|uniref:Kinesin-like protein n=1 Tax=Hexamita inflata TaxID=28002 RepID=A0AA86RNE2_9EUKA|nr:Kinesin-like protein [Hexamita inflata]
MTTSPLEVFIRFRPATKASKDIVVEPNNSNMSVINPINKSKLNFTYNEVMQNATQEEVYSKVCKKSVQHVLDGYNSCIIATGQTSAGKSYTIVGDEALTYKTRGMIARSIEEIFKTAESRPGVNFDVKFSVIEILNDKIVDLLQASSKQKQTDPPQIMESNGKQIIKNLTQIQLHNVSEGLELLFGAESCRSTGSTTQNPQSSRSHVIYLITIRQSSRTEDTIAATESKLYLVDLAGSEKMQSDSMSSYINKSLAALEQCITNLAQNQVHVPFRQSKLTHVLRDCLGGSSKTALIACVRPDEEFVLESIQTLRFAQRAVNIKTEAAVNVINRMFEAGGDQRQINSQVTQAVSEALEGQGGIGQLQAKVLRELEAENRKLKAEILLITGAEAKFQATEQDGLRKQVDNWVADAARLPELQSRADYQFCLEYMKQKLQSQPSSNSLRLNLASPPQLLTQINANTNTQQVQQSARSDSKAQPSSRGATRTYGQIAESNGLSVSTKLTFEMASTLKNDEKKLDLSQTHSGDKLEADENDRFELFRRSENGTELSKELQGARTLTKSLKEEQKSVEGEVKKLGEEVNKKKAVLAEKALVFKQNGGENANQNVVNFQQNQNQVKLLDEMQKMSTDIQQTVNKIDQLIQKREQIQDQIDTQKIKEEYARRKLMVAFEAYCAGLNKKSSQVVKDNSEEKENLLYSTILNRTKQRK